MHCGDIAPALPSVRCMVPRKWFDQTKVSFIHSQSGTSNTVPMYPRYTYNALVKSNCTPLGMSQT